MYLRLTEEEVDKRLAIQGRVVRIDPYINIKTKIRFRCLRHNEVHLSCPSHNLKGGGLACCSKNIRSHMKAKSSFDERIKRFGKVERIDEYIHSNTKIRFRCLIHNEVHLSSPQIVLSGHGLACCNINMCSLRKAKSSFDERIKRFGKVERIDEYINTYTKIKFRCLIHNEVHLSRPNDVAKGRGLKCCHSSCENKILSILLKENKKETCVYLYSLSSHRDYFKVGISGCLKNRASDPEYGDLISSWYSDSRFECFCVEQATLRDVKINRDCPENLLLSKWPGYTEVVKCPEERIIATIEYYWELIREIGPYQFALDYLDPDPEETKVLLDRLNTCYT